MLLVIPIIQRKKGNEEIIFQFNYVNKKSNFFRLATHLSCKSEHPNSDELNMERISSVYRRFVCSLA